MSVLSDIKMYGRFAWGLKSFLRDTITLEEARAIVQRGLAERKSNFLRLIERGIFANQKSPYQALFRHAGVEFGDVATLVNQEGIEGALEHLYNEGVYVTLEEFKGRQPIQRPGLELPVRAHDFDNPLLTRHYEARTGGSRGVGTRISVDFELLRHEAAYHSLFLASFDLLDRPMGLWRPLPPAVCGMNNMLRHAKLGKQVERWFTQNKMTLRPGAFKSSFFAGYAVYGSRLWGRPLPVPEHVSITEPLRVAQWLAEKKKAGTPALIDTKAGSGVRVCQVAKENGLDISGTVFRFGGEPLTAGKAQVVAKTGSRVVCHYTMAEVGVLAIACATQTVLDDVHLLKDKVAMIQREKVLGTGGVKVGSLHHTTVLPGCPKIMLNVESGDYGVFEEQSCGCALEAIGYDQRLHTIRSYEKLTSEGMTFMGSDLLTLVEETLPSRFGGHPTDYQFVEEEEGGLAKVSIFVSPRVGNVNEAQLVATVLEALRSRSGLNEKMVRMWQKGQTLQVVRREPYATSTAKILPLHVLNKGDAA